MVIVLWILIVILGLVALFYRSKAKENYHLFELSKGYGNDVTLIGEAGFFKIGDDPKVVNGSIKLNKDGSIAKKRGPKPKGAKNVKTT